MEHTQVVPACFKRPQQAQLIHRSDQAKSLADQAWQLTPELFSRSDLPPCLAISSDTTPSNGAVNERAASGPMRLWRRESLCSRVCPNHFTTDHMRLISLVLCVDCGSKRRDTIGGKSGRRLADHVGGLDSAKSKSDIESIPSNETTAGPLRFSGSAHGTGRSLTRTLARGRMSHCRCFPLA